MRLNIKLMLVTVIGAPLLLWDIFTPPADAADHLNLEEGFPAQVEDAYPLPFRDREVQLGTFYDNLGRDENRYTLLPRFETGFALNWQATLYAPFDFDDKRRGSGDTILSVLYNFNTESLKMPAFALSGMVPFPTGNDSQGVDPGVKFIMTKTIGNWHLDRLHLNLAYEYNAEPKEDERDKRYTAILGYSRRVTPDMIIVVDNVYAQERLKEEESDIVELGFRRQLDPLTVMTFGIGKGVGGKQPDFRASVGVQRTLKI